jgi:hypothetical protein
MDTQSFIIKDDFLNTALNAYIDTFPRETNLTAFLEKQHLTSHTNSIKQTLDKLLNHVSDYLYAQTNGVAWNNAFELQLFQHLKAQFSWLTTHGFASVIQYATWLCWHEGLNA